MGAAEPALVLQDCIEFTVKQELLLNEGEADIILNGGARGGGKTRGCAYKAGYDIIEWYTEAEAKEIDIDITQYRNTANDPNYDQTYYYKYVVDYPDYYAIFVRRTEKALLTSTKPECDVAFRPLGGQWVKSDLQYKFPSGAIVQFKSCSREEDLDWFLGQNAQRLFIEELTQFDQWEIEEMESACRSTHKYIKSQKIYSTNPGKKGHRYVKKRIVDHCKPIKDGDPIYMEEFDLTYQPMKPNKIYTDPKTHEKILFIPSVVFDNPFLAKKDKAFIYNLKGKNEILKQMWLYGNWEVFAGQFFSMWDDAKHTIDEKEFYNAVDDADLMLKRRRFDWIDYRLYLSNDYGFAEKAAWACGAYAVHKGTNDIIKFAEIVRSGMTIIEQAKYTKDFFERYYSLKMDDFERIVADPKSYWQRRDTKEGDFWTFDKVYQDEGIHLVPGNNDRELGAMAMLEALRIRDNGTPQLRFMSCCKETIDSIPNLPADKNNLNKVDTTVFDHPYDENRYFLMLLRGNPTEKKEEKRGLFKKWRQKVKDRALLGTYEGKPSSWKAA